MHYNWCLRLSGSIQNWLQSGTRERDTLASDQTTLPVQKSRTAGPRQYAGPIVVSIATLVALLATLDPASFRPGLPQGPGITIDESFNVQMGVYLVESLKGYGLGILHPQSVEEVFGNQAYNPDHPPLGRLWLGVFHEISRTVAPVESGDNPFITIHARAGSAVAFALTVFLIGVFATHRWGALSGTTAAISLAVMPRLFGHAHLASLETFMGLVWTTAILGTIHIWNRRVSSDLSDASDSDVEVAMKPEPPGDKASFLVGFLIGLALLTKMQAILLPPLIAVWALWHWRLLAMRPLLVSGVSTALVFVIGWPWLWLDLPGHLAEYFGRATGRVSLNVWYLGRVFKDVEVPWHYPWIMTLVTIPVGILLLAVVGFGRVGRRIFKDATSSLIVGSIIAPLMLFSLPGVAVYDGVRLFLVAFPGIALLAGKGVPAFYQALMKSKWPEKPILGVVLTCQLAGIFSTTPYFLSYYNLVVGGAYVANRSGFESTYWGDSFTREFYRNLLKEVPDDSIIQVAPVLHQFQLAEIERQVPMLVSGQPPNGRQVWLVAAGNPLEPVRDGVASEAAGGASIDTEYLAVFHRQADAPSSTMLVQSGWQPVFSEVCEGVVVASLWRRLSPGTVR